MNSYRVKYRSYWGNTIGFSTVEAESSEAAKTKVSSWGFVLECIQIVPAPKTFGESEKLNRQAWARINAQSAKNASKSNRLELDEVDLANNPPSHPGLQDLDIWTEDQMREWIKAHADMGEFIEGSQ